MGHNYIGHKCICDLDAVYGDDDNEGKDEEPSQDSPIPKKRRIRLERLEQRVVHPDYAGRCTLAAAA